MYGCVFELFVPCSCLPNDFTSKYHNHNIGLHFDVVIRSSKEPLCAVSSSVIGIKTGSTRLVRFVLKIFYWLPLNDLLLRTIGSMYGVVD